MRSETKLSKLCGAARAHRIPLAANVLLPDSQRALGLAGENNGDSFELGDVAAEPVVEDGLQEAAGDSPGGHLRCLAAAQQPVAARQLLLLLLVWTEQRTS